MNIFDKIIDTKDYKSTGLLKLNTSFFALYLNKLLKCENRGILVVYPNLYEANKLYNHLIDYNDALLFQVDDVITNEAYAISPETKLERLNILKELTNNSKRIVITDTNGYLKCLPNKNKFINNVIELKENQGINQQTLISNLINLGYNREVIISNPGDFAVRGFVIDIFPINSDVPVRLEFFGDIIEQIKTFDVSNQRTISKISNIKIYPFTEESDNDNILSYFDNPIVVFKDYEQIKVAYNRIVDDIFNYATDKTKKYICDLDEIKINDYLCYLELDDTFSDLKIVKTLDFNVTSPECFNQNIEKINKFLKDSLNNNKTIIICSEKINNKFNEMLEVPFVLTDENNIIDNKVNIISKKILSGFIKDDYIFLTDYELFNRRNIKKVKRYNYNSSKIKDIKKLEIGDYVVHNFYGIGVYNGIKTISKNGMLNDYIEVLYAKGDKLYVPASKIEYLNKYSGKEGYAPKVNALNSTAWLKTKEQVKKKIKYEAERLLKVQAERNLKKGFAFSKDNELQIMFENEFKYEMTKDQITTTENIKKEMESITPMDHILCGDVGYGKTEVAFRCMFKAVQDSKQVMYLCPTTLLSKQQYESATDRFSSFPIKIALLNRFTSIKEKNKILKDFSEGKIDILFGTHRILSKDVIPKDLGLLVVDEEQRFGVAHKEKIKEMKSNIDVLTLTATPIPRTLQMAILGLRSLSLIETPPKNRRSVQTYVIHEDKKMIRDIIYKEISRDGQVFILYNKVEDIENKVSEIRSLVPDAKIIYAHGQMPKQELEDRMNSFIEGNYNVLVCTTIIETGIDIPNANSLIIYDADRFGLSQLYQIRGRVGRSDRTSYAYLLYNKNKQLNDIAIKRLKVIKEFTELGSGFRIASRDLSIRGAGDILGAEQAGFIDAVGIDLYMKLLEGEINKLKGIEVETEEEPSKEIVTVSNHIKDSYIKDDDLKIEIHKLINTITTKEQLEIVKQELTDRFGKVDDDLINYMNEELFEKLIKKQGILKVNDNNNYIELIFNKEKSSSIDYQDFFVKSINVSNKLSFEYKNELFSVKLSKKDLDKHPIIYLNELLEKM